MRGAAILAAVAMAGSPPQYVSSGGRAMQRVVSDRPCRFVAPPRGAWWPRALQGLLPWRLRWVYGIESMEQTGAEKVAASLRAGCGVLLAPVHPV